MIAQTLAEGRLDFQDVRDCVGKRLADAGFRERVRAALAGRFKEIVVDEAQDCNPADLKIVEWLRAAGVVVKVICDPNQAIYAFRGGVTDELFGFADTFDEKDRLPMSGNFRSSPAICAAISQLRPPNTRGDPDVSLGKYKAETTPAYILAYGGTSVPATIGTRFQALAADLGIASAKAPVLASTWASAGNAVGRAIMDPGNDKTLLLSNAAMAFHFAFEAGKRREALTKLHRIVLLVRGQIATAAAYSSYVADAGLEDGRWRPEIIAIGQALLFRAGETTDAWLQRARKLLKPGLVGDSTINQRLRANAKLDEVLVTATPSALPARAIHSVKGLEFPAVCVVLTTKTASGIINVLNGASASTKILEEARKIYVAASRAERLLAIATPKSKARNLKAILDVGGSEVTILDI